MIIPTTETVRQRYFLELFLDHDKPLLLVGPTGTGKSAITNNYILRMPSDKWVDSLKPMASALHELKIKSFLLYSPVLL